MATYYVSQVDGDDEYDGLAQTDEGEGVGPWLTIAKVNGSSFSADDQILFRRGGTWREQLTVPSSGSAGLPITFGAYGTGDDPIIDGTAGTNLQPNPEDFNNAGWYKVACGIDNNSADRLAPNGAQTADGMIPTDVSTRHRFDWADSFPACSGSTTYTYSVYVSPGDVSWCFLDLVFWSAGFEVTEEFYSYFQLSGDGAIGTKTASTTATITKVSTSPLWYRVSITVTTGATSVYFECRAESASADTGNTYAGDGVSVSNYWWGAQVEASSVPTPYASYSCGILGVAKDYIKVQNIEIVDFVCAGIYNLQGDSWVVQDNTISGGSNGDYFYGIAMRGANGNLSAGCSILNNTVNQVGDTDQYLSYLYSGIFAEYTNGVTITGNTVATVYCPGITARGYNGAQSTGGATIYSNNISGFFGSGLHVAEMAGVPDIRYNRIHDGSGCGLAVNNNVTGPTIYYNVIHNIAADASQYMNGIDMNNTVTDGFIYNNTVYGVVVYCLTIETGCSGFTVKNNILDSTANVDNDAVATGQYCILETNASEHDENYDYNHYYTTGDGKVAMVEATPKTLAQWQAQLATWSATDQDAHSLDSDPLMTDPDNGDFTLQVGSPCINAGTNVGLDEDFGGTWVFGPIDIGAYAYTGETIRMIVAK